MLLELANIGYQIGAVGIIFLTLSFLITVRWWDDHLGRVIAGVMTAMSGILVMTTLRMLRPDLADTTWFLNLRVGVFWAFGLGVWVALISFIWAQFLATRLKRRRNTK